jgi:hypothetical protein
VSISANLRYELQNGTIIEVTPALETLLANSDVDLDLPMNMVVPPYCAQYLRFGALAAQHLKVPTRTCPIAFLTVSSAFLPHHPNEARVDRTCGR